MRPKMKEQIENPRSDNLPNEEFIEEIKEKYWDDQQTLCASA